MPYSPSYATPHWPMSYPSKQRHTPLTNAIPLKATSHHTDQCYTPRSYSTAHWPMSFPSKLRHTPLTNAIPLKATPHPTYWNYSVPNKFLWTPTPLCWCTVFINLISLVAALEVPVWDDGSSTVPKLILGSRARGHWKPGVQHSSAEQSHFGISP